MSWNPLTWMFLMLAMVALGLGTLFLVLAFRGQTLETVPAFMEFLGFVMVWRLFQRSRRR